MTTSYTERKVSFVLLDFWTWMSVVLWGFELIQMMGQVSVAPLRSPKLPFSWFSNTKLTANANNLLIRLKGRKNIPMQFICSTCARWILVFFDNHMMSYQAFTGWLCTTPDLWSLGFACLIGMTYERIFFLAFNCSSYMIFIMFKQILLTFLKLSIWFIYSNSWWPFNHLICCIKSSVRNLCWCQSVHQN